eukprot:gb/GECH01014175.1/.p1 GENE.gb/GECH01014175.1/~~gb/GECH01014175.1/.p1  ORF type:complete len:198 (+),score=52.42 gb/GECH01014175.1/:1-594(+)
MLTMRRNSKPDTHPPSQSTDTTPNEYKKRGRSKSLASGVAKRSKSLSPPISPSHPGQLSFDDVMNDSKARQVFKKHLVSQHNPEHILFLEEVEEYKRLALKNLATQKIQKGQQILDQFFDQSTRYALNINREDQMTIAALFRQRLALDQEPEDTLFDPVLKSVMLTLKMDSFPRFQDSALYRMLIEERFGKKRRRFF